MKRDLKLEKLVIEEATNLKKYATKEELDKLDYATLKEDDIFHCVYGQMTSLCFGYRATQLIDKCIDFKYQHLYKNNKPIISKRYDNNCYYSPIERFLIAYKGSKKIKKLIDFLKDENIKTLEL